ncbi:MAG: hypothetical protein ACP5HD_10585 [Thermoproteus sp.]
MLHFFVPLEAGMVAIEVMSRTHLGKISEGPLLREVRLVERDGVGYWTLSLEAYAVLQAARPDGPRDVDVARFALVADRVDWGRARRLAEELGVKDKLMLFEELVGVRADTALR